MLFFYIKKGSEKQRGQLAKLQWMDQGCNWGRGALGGRAPPAFHTLANDMSKHRDTTHFTPGSRPCIISSFLLLIYLCPRLRPWNGQKDNQIKLPEGVAYRIYKWKGSASHTTKMNECQFMNYFWFCISSDSYKGDTSFSQECNFHNLHKSHCLWALN